MVILGMIGKHGEGLSVLGRCISAGGGDAWRWRSLGWRTVGSLLMVSSRIKMMTRAIPMERGCTERRALDLMIPGMTMARARESEEDEADSEEIKALKVGCPVCIVLDKF
jgi:hypothetical protein